MWICSDLGFYSIVQKDGAWHVRSRTQKDLKNLLESARLSTKIQRWPGADYRWRALVQEKELGQIFVALANSIQYPNFKYRIGGLTDQRPKLPVYAGFWQGMMMLQEENA